MIWLILSLSFSFLWIWFFLIKRIQGKKVESSIMVVPPMAAIFSCLTLGFLVSAAVQGYIPSNGYILHGSTSYVLSQPPVTVVPVGDYKHTIVVVDVKRDSKHYVYTAENLPFIIKNEQGVRVLRLDEYIVNPDTIWYYKWILRMNEPYIRASIVVE